MSIGAKKQRKSPAAAQDVLGGAAPKGRSPRKPSEAMLTTDAAAELMQCSRPYVAMLIDHNKLAGASVTEEGYRIVPESSVRQWIKERETAGEEPDYHAVAEASGMYEVPEQAFIQAGKRRRP